MITQRNFANYIKNIVKANRVAEQNAATNAEGNIIYIKAVYKAYSNLLSSRRENQVTAMHNVSIYSATRLSKSTGYNSELPGVLVILVGVMTPLSLRRRAFVADGIASFR